MYGPNLSVEAKSACINSNFKFKFLSIVDSLRILRPLFSKILFVNTIQKKRNGYLKLMPSQSEFWLKRKFTVPNS